MPIIDLTAPQKEKLKAMNLDPVLQGILNNATVAPVVQFNIFTQVAGTNCDFFTETFTSKDDLSTRAPEKFNYHIPAGQTNAATGHNKSEGEDETTRLRIAWSNTNNVAEWNTTMQSVHQGGDKSQYGIADGDRLLLSRTYQKHNTTSPSTSTTKAAMDTWERHTVTCLRDASTHAPVTTPLVGENSTRRNQNASPEQTVN